MTLSLYTLPSPSTMTLQPSGPSTSTILNPFAPEYNPIPPGITPSENAPPTFFLPPPSSAASHQPSPPPPSPSLQRPPPRPSLLLSPQIFTYIPSASQQPFYTNYSNTYSVTPQNLVSRTTPPLPPPPQAAVVAHNGQPGRGCLRGRGGIGRGRGRFWSSRFEKNGREFNLNFERRPNNEKNSVGFWKGKNERTFSTRGMQKEENRHKVMPLKRDEEKTTVMIKNIPYDCPRNELIGLLDDFCLLENGKAENEGTSREEADHLFNIYAYDFLYLPIDFRTKRSRGFAFVNFTNAEAVWKFFNAFHMRRWDFFGRTKWPKKIEIVCAKIQGKEALVKHFTESIFECETDEFLPVCFSPPRDGCGQPVKLTVVGNRRATPQWAARNNHEA